MSRKRRGTRGNQVARRPQNGQADVRSETTLSVRREESFSGPMPHPDHLERYEQLHSGAAAMIFREFEAQGQHRRELENAIVTGSELRADRGQWIGAVLIGLGVAAGTAMTVAGQPVAGAGVATVALGSGALVYIVGGRPSKDSD